MNKMDSTDESIENVNCQLPGERRVEEDYTNQHDDVIAAAAAAAPQRRGHYLAIICTF